MGGCPKAAINLTFPFLAGIHSFLFFSHYPVCHELRNPLHVLKSTLAALLTEDDELCSPQPTSPVPPPPPAATTGSRRNGMDHVSLTIMSSGGNSSGNVVRQSESSAGCPAGAVRKDGATPLTLPGSTQRVIRPSSTCAMSVDTSERSEMIKDVMAGTGA